MMANPLPPDGSAVPRGILEPVRVLAVLLIVTFAVEALIMVVLVENSRFVRRGVLASLVDATLLVLVLFPVLWFMLVRPLRTLVADRGRLLAQTLDIQEQERARLARELHDDLGQMQTAILLGLKATTDATTLEQARSRASALHDLAVSAMESTRRMARALSPSVLLDFGLAEALRRLCEDLSAGTGVRVAFETELGPARFGAATEIAAYRVVQEAITNALKHSGATDVEVGLWQSAEELHLAVRDNGRGLTQEPAGGELPSCGLGLPGMRERVVLLGGRFWVRSEGEAGTTIEAAMPARSHTA